MIQFTVSQNSYYALNQSNMLLAFVSASVPTFQALNYTYTLQIHATYLRKVCLLRLDNCITMIVIR